MIPTVYVSCTIQRPSAYVVFDTIRKGFPDSEIFVRIAGQSSHDFHVGLDKIGAVPYCEGDVFHAHLIKTAIRWHSDASDNPMVILDGDVIFHERVDHWNFDTMLAGYYIPLIWNDFSQCVALPRLHTSFLWIKDAEELLKQIKESYPPAFQKFGEYCPLDPFSPRAMFIDGKPHFWDTCCGLYQMFGGTSFSEEQQAAYTHLHSASFYDVMLERLENKKGFEYLHLEGYKHSEIMKLYQKGLRDYYDDKHQQALSYGS